VDKVQDPRKSRAYRDARTKFLARSAPVCHWCGVAVSDDLPMGHPRKATTDHTIEVDRAPSLALDTRLWVVACWGCNSKRGSRYWHDGRGSEPSGVGSPSREW
jgi:5-methylcytosine-specific restriction endonuclease McrA